MYKLLSKFVIQMQITKLQTGLRREFKKK